MGLDTESVGGGDPFSQGRVIDPFSADRVANPVSAGGVMRPRFATSNSSKYAEGKENNIR